ncbi:MAG TPA: S9 family peptidase [Woeseiaceae bacterium]|nr:S9 family peptidase [Woeseiaceae bacterium]
MNLLWTSAAALLLASPAIAQDSPQRIERGNLVIEGIPDIPEAVSERLQQYENTRSAYFTGFTEDGGILITTRFAETSQVHKVDEPMGMRRQLTFYDEPVEGAAVRKDERTAFLFGKDTGGDEFYQGWLFDLETGETTQFTEAGTRNGAFAWRDDGERVAWYRSTTDSADWDILAADPADPASLEVMLEGEGAMIPLDWADSGAALLVMRYVSINRSHLYTLDLDSGELDEIRPEAEVAWSGGEFLPDGRVLTVSDEESQFQRIVIADPRTDEIEVLTPNVEWDVENLVLSPDGLTIAYTLNEGGTETLHFLELETGESRSGPELPPGLISAVDFDETGARLAFTLSSATSSGDVWVYDMEAGELTQWTQSELGGLNPENFVEPRLVEYESFDGMNIPAWVYTPEGEGPHPVIVYIHGGPEGQYRPGFSSTFQYWINELGAAVIAPNVRGSAGYGKDYLKLDNGMKRKDSVKDIGALLDWIAGRPNLDDSRIVVYGGSYGGYMVLASAVDYSERLAGAVDIVGISSFVTFLENTEDYRRNLRRAEYGDERDPEMRKFLEGISPLNNADGITVPLFIIQGANDPRVPASESEQMLEAVRENGTEAWYLLAKDEGHGFDKKANQDYMREAVTVFLNEVLATESD